MVQEGTSAQLYKKQVTAVEDQRDAANNKALELKKYANERVTAAIAYAEKARDYPKRKIILGRRR